MSARAARRHGVLLHLGGARAAVRWTCVSILSDPAPDPTFPAREFQYRAAEWWVSEYHVDGFRVDAFADIDNWEFVQGLTNRACARHQALFPTRPFYVVAEDSSCRPQAARDDAKNPNGKRVVDGIWNFAYARDARRFLLNQVETRWGEPSRSERLQALLSVSGCWDDWQRTMDEGFAADVQAINYITSHDVQDLPRLMTQVLLDGLARSGLLDRLRGQLAGTPDWAIARYVVDQGDSDPALAAARDAALERVVGAFALLLTSCGLPMLLAGEEFGDVHDLDPGDWHAKMSDPVDWTRAVRPAHASVMARVQELIALRQSSAAVQSGPAELFYCHPAFDDLVGPRVFGYSRTGGRSLGSTDQVIVIGNLGQDAFASYLVPGFPWAVKQVTEVAAAARGSSLTALPTSADAELSLEPFQVRVFQS